jgi:NAD kinase
LCVVVVTTIRRVRRHRLVVVRRLPLYDVVLVRKKGEKMGEKKGEKKGEKREREIDVVVVVELDTTALRKRAPGTGL